MLQSIDVQWLGKGDRTMSHLLLRYSVHPHPRWDILQGRFVEGTAMVFQMKLGLREGLKASLVTHPAASKDLEGSEMFLPQIMPEGTLADD